MIIGSIKTMTNSMAGGLGAIALLMVLGAIAAVVLAPSTSAVASGAGHTDEGSDAVADATI